MAVARHPNVAAKASALPRYSSEAYPYRRLHPCLERVFDAFGPHRFFWGTDMTGIPCTYRQAVTLFTEELPWLRGADRDLVMGAGAYCGLAGLALVSGDRRTDFWRREVEFPLVIARTASPIAGAMCAHLSSEIVALVSCSTMPLSVSPLPEPKVTARPSSPQSIPHPIVAGITVTPGEVPLLSTMTSRPLR